MYESVESRQRRCSLKKKIYKKLRKTNFSKSIIRICKKCKQTKRCAWNYSFTLKNKPNYYTLCNSCRRHHSNMLRKKRREKLSLSRKKRIYKRKQLAVEYLGGKCQVCGYNKCIAALDFHHINPKYKKKDLSLTLDSSLKKLYRELNKCRLLCSNCHREYHYYNK